MIGAAPQNFFIIAGFWLLGDTNDTLNPATIRDMIAEVGPQAHHIILEVSNSGAWAA